ncbi:MULTISPECIES: universal stress protein [unclassified Sphingobacterium]|uniref:universal stress protein n=1 Tax=unclassified Sphingobacterium TaxID=2609468 RepID=UPI001AE72C65|nr:MULTISPECIES: universal stress protein [unclassified Sphingobacterium]MDR6735700.1 nucleotide-binding universal stress UspA family protein [Sphingobacterium sp. 2149]
MKKNILLPVDFSAHAINAVNYAVNLSLEKGYALHLYHNYTSASAVFEEENSPNDANSPIFKADILIKDLAESIKLQHPTLQISTQCERGMITETLPELATPDQFDFLVMGTKGITNEDSKLIGSTTYVISKKAKIPVLAIPNEAYYTPIDTVGLLSNFKEEEIHTVKDFVNIIGKDFELKLMHVHYDHSSENRIEDKLEVWKYKIKKHIGVTNIAIEVDSIQGDIEDLDTVPEVINEMIHNEKIKILLVTRSRKSFFERVFSRSVAKALFSHPLIPIFFTKA